MNATDKLFCFVCVLCLCARIICVSCVRGRYRVSYTYTRPFAEWCSCFATKSEDGRSGIAHTRLFAKRCICLTNDMSMYTSSYFDLGIWGSSVARVSCKTSRGFGLPWSTCRLKIACVLDLVTQLSLVCCAYFLFPFLSLSRVTEASGCSWLNFLAPTCRDVVQKESRA